MSVHALRAYRKAEGLTLKQLADRIGVQLAAVSRWELGQRMPTRDTLEKISRVTGLSYEQILRIPKQDNDSV